ncbi:MAG: hypothetical protein E7378_01330 [Clostridiales bacterium]|nr:hypothetical protein [Clostridiales bacterium]
MSNGIKTLIDGDHCGHCDTLIKGKYNFCPNCGNALTADAIRLLEQKEKRTKIELLDELAYEIKNADALKVILEKIKQV